MARIGKIAIVAVIARIAKIVCPVGRWCKTKWNLWMQQQVSHAIASISLCAVPDFCGATAQTLLHHQ